MKIEDATVEALKAQAYDFLANIEQCQMGIKAINQELAKRANVKPSEEKTSS